MNGNKRKLISVVMPVYNGERYIGSAIESVINQTYENWELIIVDDASTDNTIKVVQEYNDDRIKLFVSEYNSGAAFTPRNKAIELSNGELIVNLDADDVLENDYLFKMCTRIEESDADVCCGQMTYQDELLLNEVGTPIPNNSFDFNQIIDGKTAFNYTVPIYQIGLNGAMVKKTIWENTFKEFEIPEHIGVHDDENLFRVMLVNSNRVVFAKTQYVYRTNSTSITQVFNERIFEIGESNKELFRYVEKYFEIDSCEYKSVLEYDFNAFFASVRLFVLNMDLLCDEQKKIYIEKLKIWQVRLRNNTQWNKIRTKKRQFSNNSLCLIMLMCLKKMKMKSFFFCIKYIMRTMKSKIEFSDRYRWYIIRKKREKNIKKQLLSAYKQKCTSNRSKDNYVINIYNGDITAGGFADRLRGIISTYSICKQKGIEYKLYFNNPFPLEAYLVPNEYDWTIKADNIRYDIPNNGVVILDTTADTKYQEKKQKKFLERKISNKSRQYHVYTNAFFSYGLDYCLLFKELFKPSDRLQYAINEQLSILKQPYISVSCRFLDLLGDFNETFGYGSSLNKQDREKLISRTIDKITMLHENNKDLKILVNSDSCTFLEVAKELEYVYVIPGNVTHIDNENSDFSYEKYEKTMLDFFMIANAEKIYLLKEERMHKSGYPYAASKLYGKSFEIIEY